MSEFPELLPFSGSAFSRSRGRLFPLLIALGLITAAQFGCGSTEPAPATHRDFRSIQRFEATIFGAQGDLEGPCEGVLEAHPNVCTASRGICIIAEDTGDLDARSRCERATVQCERAEARAGDCSS